MSKSKVQKTIFESYTDVINKGMKAGKDMSVAVKRLNHLMTEHKKMKKVFHYKLSWVFLSSQLDGDLNLQVTRVKSHCKFQTTGVT